MFLSLTAPASYCEPGFSKVKKIIYIYHLQVLGKSAKPIPVLILGVVLGRKSYPLIKYLCVLLIVTGVAIFLYKDKPSVKTVREDEEKQWTILGFVGFGELLVVRAYVLHNIHVTAVTNESTEVLMPRW